MNAGAFGTEVSDIFSSATFVRRDGLVFDQVKDEIEFGYRRTRIPTGTICVACVFHGKRAEPATIKLRIAELTRERKRTQPLKGRTAGSTFCNPPGQHARTLIARAGCSGLVIGGARLSSLNPNFILADSTAVAADVEMLIERVRMRVKVQLGVDLDLELKIVGDRTAQTCSTR